MRRLAKQRFVPILCLGLVIGVGACAKKSVEETSSTPAAPVSVTGLDLGRNVGGDKRVTESVNEFTPSDVIYASVRTSGTSSAATLKARWTYQDGQLVEETEQTIAPAGDAATEFHISKPEGWPLGRYKVEVFLNGSPAQSKEFDVKSS